MNKTETASLMAIIKLAYPQYYSRQDEILSAVNLWAEMFKEDDFNIVSAGVKSFIASDIKGFPPSIGMIKAYISRITTPEEMTEIEAWGLIKKALRNSAYNSQDEYDKLPEELQRLIGSHNQLKEWAISETSEVDTVIASNFMRSFRARIQSIREYKALPTSVKQFIGTMANGMSLETLDTGMLKQNALKQLEG